MSIQKPSEEVIERLRNAPPNVSDSALSRELGVHRNTVRKYRAEGKQERQEIAREVVARHVEANIPDALTDLTRLRELARKNYEAKGDSRQGALWLAAIKTTLEHVRPDDSDLDADIEDELASLAEARKGAVSRTSAGAAGGSAAFN